MATISGRDHGDGDAVRRGRRRSTSRRRARLARHLVENGSHGLVVAGTTGESPTLSRRREARAC